MWSNNLLRGFIAIRSRYINLSVQTKGWYDEIQLLGVLVLATLNAIYSHFCVARWLGWAKQIRIYLKEPALKCELLLVSNQPLLTVAIRKWRASTVKRADPRLHASIHYISLSKSVLRAPTQVWSRYNRHNVLLHVHYTPGIVCIPAYRETSRPSCEFFHEIASMAAVLVAADIVGEWTRIPYLIWTSQPVVKLLSVPHY